MGEYGQWQLVTGGTDGRGGTDRLGGGGDMDDSDRSTPAAPRPRFPDQCTKICVYLVQFLRSYFGLRTGLGLYLGYLASSGAESGIIFVN